MLTCPVNKLTPVPDWVYAPLVVIPDMPVMTPVVDISQSEELTAIVSRPLPSVNIPARVTALVVLPIVTVPVEVPVLILVAKLEDALRLTIPPVLVMAALFVIPDIPVMTPVVEIAQSEELMKTYPKPSPMVIPPVPWGEISNASFVL